MSTNEKAQATVRAATAADFEAWLPLWRGYQAFYKMSVSEAQTLQTWQRFLDPASPLHLALAEADAGAGAAVLGMVHYIDHHSTTAPVGYVYLQDLYTAQEARGRGLGRALIEHVYAHARETGATRVHWLTHHSNEQAMVLYDQVAEKSGFVQYRKVF
jgi:ribosomal protein S18 acetylase RimI-like enzyme